jgi:hypothetical protein
MTFADSPPDRNPTFTFESDFFTARINFHPPRAGVTLRPAKPTVAMNMNKCLPVCLGLLAALVTGCPRNQYVVELTPHGDALERRLVFYRENGKDTNGVTICQDFPEDQLAAIKKVYPQGGVKADGQRHIAQGQFVGAMPNDVGGAGGWTNLATTMGNAALYSERFRGSDDFAITSKNKLEAIDQLTDLLIGWSRMELGQEPKYENLHRFLDVDFRRDVKNFTLYNWAQEISANFNSKADEEFAVRFGQYLRKSAFNRLAFEPKRSSLRNFLIVMASVTFKPNWKSSGTASASFCRYSRRGKS